MKHPQKNERMFQTAVTLLQQGNLPAADQACREILKQGSKNVDALHLHGVVANRMGDYSRAKTRLRKAAKLKPSVAKFHNSLALALRNNGELNAAAVAAKRAIKLQPNYPGAYYNLGLIEEDRKNFAAALAAYESACEKDPRMAQAHSARGLALQILGRMDDAREAFRHALELQPDFAEVHFHLAHARRADDENDAQVVAIERLLASESLNPDQEAWLQSALGKLRDDLGQHARAFQAFQRANQQVARKSVLYNVNSKLAEPFIDAFTSKRLAQRVTQPARNDRILIVGMPRSGSTLLETMLSSHAEVEAGGERHELKDVWLNTLASKRDSLEQFWAQADTATLERASKELKSCLATPQNARFLTDKMPGNLWHLGMVGRLMPETPILFTWREPRDVGLSCYFTRFQGNHHRYSYDLYATGRMIRATHMMIEHWLQVLPNPMVVVEYERLVSATDTSMKIVCECCGLDPSALASDHTNAATAVTTASNWQVRQKLYQRSIGRWKHYENQLEPLLKGLGPVAELPAPGRD